MRCTHSLSVSSQRHNADGAALFSFFYHPSKDLEPLPSSFPFPPPFTFVKVLLAFPTPFVVRDDSAISPPPNLDEPFLVFFFSPNEEGSVYSFLKLTTRLDVPLFLDGVSVSGFLPPFFSHGKHPHVSLVFPLLSFWPLVEFVVSHGSDHDHFPYPSGWKPGKIHPLFSSLANKTGPSFFF